jgi:hypothetical protein
MKQALAILLLIIVPAASALAGNYVLEIDGKPIELDLNRETAAALPDGKKATFRLTQKEIILFSAGMFSFEHKSVMSPSRKMIQPGLHQTMISSPTGTLIMVQEYSTLNPSSLIDLMIRELTKEEIQYGYKYSEAPVRRELADGTTVTGKKAVTEYQGNEWTREVLAYGKRDNGVLIVTAIEKGNAAAEADILALFWKSLKLAVQ